MVTDTCDTDVPNPNPVKIRLVFPAADPWNVEIDCNIGVSESLYVTLFDIV